MRVENSRSGKARCIAKAQLQFAVVNANAATVWSCRTMNTTDVSKRAFVVADFSHPA
jgi:hypothetical protein